MPLTCCGLGRERPPLTPPIIRVTALEGGASAASASAASAAPAPAASSAAAASAAASAASAAASAAAASSCVGSGVDFVPLAARRRVRSAVAPSGPGNEGEDLDGERSPRELEPVSRPEERTCPGCKERTSCANPQSG